MDKIGKIISIILFAVATGNFCLGNLQEAIYFVLSAIHINLVILIDKK